MDIEEDINGELVKLEEVSLKGLEKSISSALQSKECNTVLVKAVGESFIIKELKLPPSALMQGPPHSTE